TVEQALRIAARAEAFERETETALTERVRERRRFAQLARRNRLGDLEADARGLRAARADVIVEPVEEGAIAHRVLRQAHEQAAGLALCRKGQRRAHDPAVDVL